MKSDTSQINVKVPVFLKSWAKARAHENYQSMSGFIAKLLHEEKTRQEQKNREVENEMM